MNKNDSIIFSSFKEAEQQVKNVIPEGYLEIKLSTKGKLGAPEVFHIRNFKVRDVLALSLTSDSDLPIRLINVLNDMILEDVDVSQWHEKEIEETMVYVFMTFFKPVLEDIAFPLTNEDIELIKQTKGEETYKALREGKYIPRTSIKIQEDVDTYDLDDDFKPQITITNKKTGFYCTFDWVKYGDQLIIKRWLDSYFADKEARFKRIQQQIAYNNSIKTQLKDSPEVIDKLIDIDPIEEEEYRNYRTERIQVLSEMVKIISIIDFNGQDVSSLSASEKYELMADDARIDAGMITKLNKRQAKMQFGIKPEVSMVSPITGEVVKRPLPFRLTSLIQTMSISGDDGYDDGYGDED